MSQKFPQCTISRNHKKATHQARRASDVMPYTVRVPGGTYVHSFISKRMNESIHLSSLMSTTQLTCNSLSRTDYHTNIVKAHGKTSKKAYSGCFLFGDSSAASTWPSFRATTESISLYIRQPTSFQQQSTSFWSTSTIAATDKTSDALTINGRRIQFDYDWDEQFEELQSFKVCLLISG